jgi:hypothetical protein
MSERWREAYRDWWLRVGEHAAGSGTEVGFQAGYHARGEDVDILQAQLDEMRLDRDGLLREIERLEAQRAGEESAK